MNKISPFEKVRKGDVIILKESGGLVNGVFVAGEVKFYQGLNKKVFEQIESVYGNEICTSYDKNFWKRRTKAKYASLIEVKKVKKITPFKCEKNDRSGWSILREGISEDLFAQVK
jgi:hypothetical protein